LETWRARDPIQRLRAVLEATGIEAAQIDTLDATVQAEVEAAVEFAKASPPPRPESALTDMWVEVVVTTGARS
jgi:pyruvate dehydrogenase E1 component alpha subunit